MDKLYNAEIVYNMLNATGDVKLVSNFLLNLRLWDKKLTKSECLEIIDIARTLTPEKIESRRKYRKGEILAHSYCKKIKSVDSFLELLAEVEEVVVKSDKE
jgi:hypothetical protein